MNVATTTTASVSEGLAAWLGDIQRADLPDAVAETMRKLLLDVTGLCVAARRQDYIRATLGSFDRAGSCTALGQGSDFGACDAALVNGTAAHGEDYDDTFEGGPVHSGAVIVPAVLAACEREGLGGERLLIGLSTGVELLCRLGLVAPKAIHKAGFHPTAVLGALAAAGGVSAALGLPPRRIADAIGIAGSMASGIIEYLADGSWTKRMHAGWAAQSGIRAALLARGGFVGPRTVLEGEHGFFKAFAPSLAPAFGYLVDDLGRRWVSDTIAFKPYACGTMTQPFIDCAIELARRGVQAGAIDDILCLVGEGTVHRLWEPLALKHRPPTPYAAKFSTPYCMAIGFLRGKAGLAQFTDASIADPELQILSAKIRYVVDPADEYPRNFTGRIRATLKDGTVHEIRQGYMRGGAHAPLSTAEVESKFADNAAFGGWSRDMAGRFLALSGEVFSQSDLFGGAGVWYVSETRELEGLVAIVTGSARNIGRAIATELAAAGAAVMINARSNGGEVEQAVADISAAGGNAAGMLADVTDPKAVEGLVAATADRFGGVDILVNNAALRRETAFAALGFEEWREVLSIILDGAYLTSHAALPFLERSRQGSIVNIGGLSAHTGAANRAHVVAAKAGLAGLTRGLAHDLAGKGITVNCVAPGMIDTVRGGSAATQPSHHAQHQPPLGRRGTSDEIAALVRYLCGPAARYITGQTVHANGGAFMA